MGLFQKVFGRNRGTESRKKIAVPLECKNLIELNRFMEGLFTSDSYVSRRDYASKIMEESGTVDFFRVLKRSNMLKSYCGENNVSPAYVERIIDNYDDIKDLVDRHNKNYVEKHLKVDKEYLDNVLKASDPNIVLDENQRRVVLTDEDYVLVVAGAGAGKTTTVAAKVKYLVDKKKIDPKDILVISFTNKAVNELKERIIGELHIECPITTFHATGNAIIRKHNTEKLNIVEESKLYYVVSDYFKTAILTKPKAVENIILFFASYIDAPFDEENTKKFISLVAKANYTTLRSEFANFEDSVIDRRTKKTITIKSEPVRSRQEVEIANFLYLNGIDYKYEPVYPYNLPYSRKPYTPDFIISQDGREAYIEHFGVTEDGRNNRYTAAELEKYKNAINDKVKLHREHGTDLIYTFSSYNDRRSFTDHLKEKLIAHGYELRPRSSEEVFRNLVDSEENRYIRRLVNLMTRFIGNFKTNGFGKDDFKRLRDESKNERNKLFLDICYDCYLEYERVLKENNAVDFQDMINESARLLREVKEMKKKLHFKYVIVDEYQDISRQRFDLVKALSEVTDAKIIAVGDDWQSIYAFSGSDITLFTKFREKMGYGECLSIVNTYRNAQEVIDIAGNFIQKNDKQIKKALVSPKHIKDPIIIYTYDGSKKKDAVRSSGSAYAVADAVNRALGDIIRRNNEEGKKKKQSILLLGRYNFDGDQLERTGEFIYTSGSGKLKSNKYPWLDITFMSAHSSKGLGYDNVIVINGRNETYGFPSKIEDDPILNMVIHKDDDIEYAEERRLFYVAMTRTKNRVYFVAPEENPSEFLLELVNDYSSVVKIGDWNDDPENVSMFKKSCPMCGYPMQYRYKKNMGLSLHICMNEPEICGFMTNSYAAGKLSILKCDSCQDGYLIVKPSKTSDYFLGCSNYKKDGTGCKNTMTRENYYNLVGITYDIPAPKIEITRGRDISPKNVPVAKKVESVKEVPQEKRYKDVEKVELKELEFRGYSMSDIIHRTFQALLHISEVKFYGKMMIAETLKGTKAKKLLTANLDKTKEYASLHNMSIDEICIVLEWGIRYEYITKTTGLYPVLHPTYKCESYKDYITDKEVKTLYGALTALKDFRLRNEIDICRDSAAHPRFKEMDTAEIIRTALSCVEKMNHMGGKKYETVCDILLGRKINKDGFFKFTTMPEYGVFRDFNRNEIRVLLQDMRDKCYLVKSG
ncbi:MAG: UvrD-helicase domain-containing protein [Clostridia bacterium]|nr:UvrD-helicase domain-containing protein [Clostridia bacterium]